MKIDMNILAGQVTLEERVSDYNGPLTVVGDIFYGTYIKGGGLPQSGGLAEIIWRNTLNKITSSKKQVTDALILGLGGGGIAKILRKNYPEIKITGVDIDPVIVDLGKKYLKLDEQNVDIKIQDVNEFKTTKKYDLVCVDTYQGDQFPEEFATEEFAKKVKSFLHKDGIAIFNRLYGPEDRKIALEHEKVLEKVFASVERNYPEANIMFVCKSD